MIGCATTSRNDVKLDKRKAPPDLIFQQKWKHAGIAELESLQTGPREQNISWWKSYILATTLRDSDMAKSCRQFQFLSQQNDFPLQELALLRTHEVCPKDELTPLPDSLNAWYKNLYLELRMKENEDSVIALERARAESNARKREQFFLRALELAQKEKNPAQEENVRVFLYKNSPRFIPNPELKDQIAVAQDFRGRRDFAKAIEIYRGIVKNPKSSVEEKFSALKGIRQTYKIQQNKHDYIEATTELVNWSKDQYQKNKTTTRAIARFHDAQVLLARTLWTEDQTSLAVKTLNETLRLLKNRYPMDEVYFILGRIDEEKGHLEKALEYYQASSLERSTLPGLRDKILWLKAWNAFKLKKYELASASFQQMKDTVIDPSEKNRAAFWLGRTYKVLEQNDKAREQWNFLTKEDPLGYYGTIAYRDLQNPLPAISIDEGKTFELNILNVSELPSESRLTIEWLIAVGETDFVEKILNQSVEELKRKNVSNEDTWLRVTSTYARAGLYLPLFSALGALPANVKNQLLNEHPDLLFPLAYRSLVEKAAAQSETPAAFIYSIMRQESAFNPEARSPVDAFGLMQLLPSLAQNLARDHKVRYQEAEDLFDPETSITLGAYELKNLTKRYKDQFILATAAYNANASAIRGWLKTRFRDDPVEFIEEIPYEETRAYIKLVMRNYVFYQRLLQKGQALPFPENLLSLEKPTSTL